MQGTSFTNTLCDTKSTPTRGLPLASGFAENVAIGGRPRTWPCGVAVAAVEAAVRGGCELGKATVRPSGFWPYCTGWNNLDAHVGRRTASPRCRSRGLRDRPATVARDAHSQSHLKRDGGF